MPAFIGGDLLSCSGIQCFKEALPQCLPKTFFEFELKVTL